MIGNERNINSINDWADFWYYEIGANVIPANTREKASYIKWSQHQYKAIPNELHEEHKKNGNYNNGIAVITGQIWRGRFQGKFLVAIDLDNKKAIDEFVKDKLQLYKQITLVEQHENPDKMHLYFIVDRELHDKAKHNLKSDKIDKNEVPAIEVKATPKHMMCCAFSPHKDGSNYQIKGTLKPQAFSADMLEEQIRSVCDKFGIQYGPDNNDISNGESFNDNKSWNSSTQSTTATPLPEPLRQIIILLGIPDNFEYKILEGSRHATMLSFVNSLLIKHRDNQNRDKLKEFFHEVNDKICSPPLPDNEIKTIWKDAVKFAEDKIKNIQIINNDENDRYNYNSQIVVPLNPGDKLLEQEIVQNFVYDIQTESVSCDFNHKVEAKKVIVPVDLKDWNNKVRKTWKKLLQEKGLPQEIIDLLVEALDLNYDLIKQKYYENQRRQNAVTQEQQLQRKERQRLIQEGTDFLMCKYKFATIEESKDILYYDAKNGVYVAGGEIIIQKELEKKYGYRLKTADIVESTNYIIRKTYVKKEEFDKDLDIINLKNGLLNWKLGQLYEHTPDYKSLNQKPIIYNTEAKPTKFLKFLNEVIYPQDIRTAIEIIAYTFIRKNLFEYYFVLIGRGSNGKNVFIGILSHLHGLKNISNVSLKSLVKNRFAFAQLENKDINVDTELSNNFVNDMSILKKLTGSQPIMLERKGRDPYEVELWAKLFFNANELPLSTDNSDAHFRRQIILSFWNQFEEETKDNPKIKLADPYLLSKIVNDPEEMSGILNLVIDALRTIDANKKIHINSTIAERRAKAELTANPVKAFAEQFLMKSASDDIYETGKNLYERFVEFCKSKVVQIPDDTVFAKELKKLDFQNARPRIEGIKTTIWYVKLFTTEDEKAAAEEVNPQ